MSESKDRPDVFEVAVIGGGVAGAASALRAGQYNIPCAWIMGNKDSARRSRGRWVHNIDNMIGVHPGIVLDKLAKRWRKDEKLLEALDDLAPMAIGTQDLVDNVVGRLRDEESTVTFIQDLATHATREDGFLFRIDLGKGDVVRARNVVLATGVMDRQPSVAMVKKGEVKDEIKWVYPFANRESLLYCIRCEGHLTRHHKVAVIGHSETAAQIALMLCQRYGSSLAILTNGEELDVAPETTLLLEHYGIQVESSRIVEMRDEAGKARGDLNEIVLEDGTVVQVRHALVSLGIYRVYNDLARELGAELYDPDEPEEQRHVLVDSRGETSVPGLFAVGDMAKRSDEPIMKQVYTSQEYAVRAIDSVDRRWRRRMREAILDSSKSR